MGNTFTEKNIKIIRKKVLTIISCYCIIDSQENKRKEKKVLKKTIPGITLTDEMREILDIYKKLKKNEQEQMLAVIQGFNMGLKQKEKQQ